MKNQMVYDREGRQYEVTAQEADHMINSGAYFASAAEATIVQPAMITGGASDGRLFVFDITTGEKLERWPVDAQELVRTGHYSFIPPASAAQDCAVSADVVSPANDLPEGDEQPPVYQFPELTMDNSKDEILTVLAQYGVLHRANMAKDALLDLWESFVLENSGQ